MYRLRQSQWDLLKSELERNATGATIHNVRQTFSWTKDRVEMWCSYISDVPRYEDHKERYELWLQEASSQLKIYGHSDIDLFIENV